MRILLVEDDRLIGATVEGALRDQSYAVDWVRDGEAALASLRASSYDLMLLDLGLPRRDGMAVLRTVRADRNTIPIVIVTARDALEDRVMGLDLGADDYVLKPFELDELEARIRAVMRRKQGSSDPILSNGALTLDPATHEVRGGDFSGVLPPREFSLLRVLLGRPGQIFSRSELEERIYGWGEEVESNAVEYLIRSLRKKLGQDAIKNVRGVGWLVPKAA
ncbi:MAG: response regulator transcription factor [Burkholderiales bacterium]|nr:response regulator transcription factor [Burkholderiales bacterium]